MNFSNVKNITIPEGKVTKIADSSGNVLWKQAPSGAKVKVTVKNSGMYASSDASIYTSLLIDGVNHNTTEEIVVPIGTVISCRINTSGYSMSYSVKLNGTQVTYDTQNQYGTTYNYTVTGDVDIVIGSGAVMGQYGPSQYTASINITELVWQPTKTYSITNNLTNCSNSNIATTIAEGESYSANISCTSEYMLLQCTVTMGGTQINAFTQTGGRRGTISIAEVTGDIVITALAEN